MNNYSTEILQIGTTGFYETKSFKIVGRIRTWFEESVFNYWTVQFADNSKAVLSEGYGLYAILLSRKIETSNGSPDKVNHLEPGDIKKWKGAFQVQKNDKSIMCEKEGELFVDFIPYSARIIDFSSPYGKQIVVFEFNNEHFLAYDAHEVEFNKLELANLRSFRFEEKKVPCKNCNNTIIVLTFPYAQSCACPHCRAFYATDSGINFRQVAKATSSAVPDIALRSKGNIKGIDYEVIGFAIKQETNIYAAQWREYTLYNSAEGYAFLSEFNGHWIYIRERLNSPTLTNRLHDNFTFDGESFQLYNSYNYEIINATGEFPYNIFDNENTYAREFISPPEVWIEEKNAREGIIWYHGEYIHKSDIVAGFSPDNIPPQSGIGSIQPTGYVSINNLVLAFLIGLVILSAIHLLITSSAEETTIVDQTFEFAQNQQTISYVTPKLNLDKGSSNMKFEIAAPVSNSWFELNATLVNVETGTEYSLQQGVEYYSGYSDGESWSEGSQSESAWLTSIPKGNYYLQISGTKEKGIFIEGIQQFTLIVKYDVPMRSNLLYAFLFLLIWPVGRFLLDNYHYEKLRWADSPHSPYEQ